MPNSDLLPSLFFKINENQLTLGAAIMDFTLYVEQRRIPKLASRDTQLGYP